MDNTFESLMAGPYKYLVWFGIAIVLIYIPAMCLWIRRKKDKAAIFEHEHRDAVKVYIQRTEINDLLRVISVNGEKPVVHAKGVRQGFYLLPGKSRIHVVYQWTTISITSVSGYETHTVNDEEMDVTVQAGKEYSLCYNHDTKNYEFNEK